MSFENYLFWGLLGHIQVEIYHKYYQQILIITYIVKINICGICFSIFEDKITCYKNLNQTIEVR